MESLPIRLDWVYQQQYLNSIDTGLIFHPSILPIVQRWKEVGYQRLYNETLEPESVPNFFATLVRLGVDFQEGIRIARDCMHKLAPKISDPGTQWLVRESSLKLYHALAEKGYAKQEAVAAIKFLPDAPIAKNIMDLCNS